jgi:hypothetical protein
VTVSFPPGPPSHPLSGTAHDAVLFVEDVIRPLPYEVAAWFEPNGNEIGRRIGRRSDVTFTATEAASMKDAIFTHNHPDGWNFPASDPRRAGNSFSDDDFDLAVRADVIELRAVTPTLRFSLRRPADGWGTDPATIRLYHAVIMSVVSAELNLAVQLGTRTLEARDATLYHETARRLADHFGFGYERWEG